MNQRDNTVVQTIDQYYSDKIRQHGPTPQGVDWNGEDSQTLRYDQLLKLLPEQDFSICDLGCGYGGLLDHLARRRSNFRYTGVDISAEMVSEAQRLHVDERCRFVRASAPPQPVDYVVASGIFNVRPGISDETWCGFVLDRIADMDATSRHGFAFNCLTSRSDPDRRRDYLHYADPAHLLTHCLAISRHVALLHDYGLYEFTILVHKEPT